MKYDILLFDADNTVLDFNSAESQALQRAFLQCNLPFDQHTLQVYRKHNVKEWQRYEKEEITRDEVLVNRFAFTFEELQLPFDGRVCHLYEQYLHDGFDVVPFAEEVLQRLQKVCRLYIVTNGVLSIQNSRMKGSGLEKYFEKRFVSEEIGFPKPKKQFFDYCFAHIPNVDKSKTLLIGDSLSSDILGGINAGIDTCWYNPEGKNNQSDIKPTYEIDDLRRLYPIVQG